MKLIIDLPDKIYENIKKRGFVSSRYDLKIAVAVDNGKPLQEELEEIKEEIQAKEKVECSIEEMWYNFAIEDFTKILEKRIKEIEE